MLLTTKLRLDLNVNGTGKLLLFGTTSWKVVGLIVNEIIDFFNRHNPSSHIMALESTQLLTEMSTRNIPGSKGWLAFEAHNLTANYQFCRKFGSL
jgi:hypothetical protein